MKLSVADLQKRWQARTALAVTLESGRVAVDLVRRDHGESRLVQSFALPFGAEAVVADPEKAGQALVEQLEAAGIRERRCVVCIPPGWALTTSTDLPGISNEDLRGYLELRAEREFPIAVSDLRLAHCSYRLPDGKEHATLAAVAVKKIEAVERMLETAGARAVSISLGLDRCLPQRELPAAMHFLANGDHVDLIVSAGGGIAALRSLRHPAASDEEPVDPANFCREVRITLGRLPEAVRQQVREARFAGAPAPAENLRLETRQQLQGMGIESRLSTPRAGLNGAGAAVEAAEHHLRQQPVVFEFVAPQTSRWQTMVQRFDSRRRRWITAAALALVVLPAVVFLVRSNEESRLEAKWGGMRKSVGELEGLQQKIRRFRPWFDPEPRSIQVLDGLTAAFPDEGEVWAKSIQVSEGPNGEGAKVTCSGLARSQPALMGLLDRLRGRPDVAELKVQQMLEVQQGRGSKQVQFSFTFQWKPRDAK